MTSISASHILTGTNKGFFISVNEKNKLTGSEIYKGIFFNDDVIYVNQLKPNYYITLSNQGLIKILHLEENSLNEIDRMQLKTKSIPPNWVTQLDNGHLAILTVNQSVTVNQSGLFEVYFVSFGDYKIKTDTVICDESLELKAKFIGIDKIHPGQGDVIYAIAYAKNGPEALWRRLVKISIKDGFQVSVIRSNTDDTSYGKSMSCSLAMISKDISKASILVGFDLCSRTKESRKGKDFFINRLCEAEASAFFSDPMFGMQIKFSSIASRYYNVNGKIDPDNPFLQILPNQYLFVREKDQFVIYSFPLMLVQPDWDPYIFGKVYSINIPKEKKPFVRNVSQTENGNVLINCGDHIYEWYLKGNELVEQNRSQLAVPENENSSTNKPKMS